MQRRYGNQRGWGGGNRRGRRRRPGPHRENSDKEKKIEKDKEVQQRPAQQWTRVKPIGENTGGLNGGIFIVKDHTGKKYIEKRAKKELIQEDVVLREITILKYLSKPSHPHITRMVDHFVDQERTKASIYLEWCDMGGLESFIEARVASDELFNEEDVWEWFIQLFDALTYCHYGPDPKARLQYTKPEDWQNGWDMVYHRDIKVDNILVCKGGPQGQGTGYTLKLADFGCAVARRHIWTDVQDKKLQNPWKTWGWMPPEYPIFTGRSDVWQLAMVVGCICNVMRMPFFDTKDPSPGYSRDLANVIVSSTVKDHKKRPKADEVLQKVKEKYQTIRPDLEQNPKPVPAKINKTKRMNQMKRGDAELSNKIAEAERQEQLQMRMQQMQQAQQAQMQMQRQRQHSAPPVYDPRGQGAGRFGGAGNVGFGGGGKGGLGGFQHPLAGRRGNGGHRGARMFTPQPPNGYESDDSMCGNPYGGINFGYGGGRRF